MHIFTARRLFLSLCLFLVCLLACSPAALWSQESSPAIPGPDEAPTATADGLHLVFEIPAMQQWLDTQLDLRAGEKLRFTSSGTAHYPKGKTFGPEGLPRAIKDVVHEYAVPDGNHGAVIAQLGQGDVAQPFVLGINKEYVAPVAGRLHLGVNESLKDAKEAEGSFRVRIEVLDPGSKETAAGQAGGPPETKIPGITTSLLTKIPRRVSDEKGALGDMVNIFMLGTEKEVVQVFAAAGWVKVDRSVGKTLLAGLEDTIKKEDYLTFPMSTLYLFDRQQDYGFAHAEPIRVLMSRNHLRVWESPYLVKGKPLWCVAATHDIGFERDQRNNLVTHKIDPVIDGEREYVNDTLSSTGLVIARGHVTPPHALTSAKTATGGGFHSDGRILILVLKAKPPAAD
jgi:LssY C-terminus